MLTSRAINCVNSLHKESLKHLMRKIYFTTCYAVNRTELPLVRDLSSNVKEEAVVPLRSVKGKSDTNPVRKFVDCVEVEVMGGREGTAGSVSSPCLPWSSPDPTEGTVVTEVTSSSGPVTGSGTCLTSRGRSRPGSERRAGTRRCTGRTPSISMSMFPPGL